MYQHQIKLHLSYTENKIYEGILKQGEIKKFSGTPVNIQFTQIEQIIDSCLHIISDTFGSAVCISEEGFILTCAHCAKEGD
jgi:hypothetical protein